MIKTIVPGPRSGTASVPVSKSALNRWLLLAALGQKSVTVHTGLPSEDIDSMVRCIRALGAQITAEGEFLKIEPSDIRKPFCVFDAGSSATALRFLLPVSGVRSEKSVFLRSSSLAHRPVQPLLLELSRHGMRFTEKISGISCEGRLTPGSFRMAGSLSSQYLSGLMIAMAAMDAPSDLTVRKPVVSAGYLAMTVSVLRQVGIHIEEEDNSDCIRYSVFPSQVELPDTVFPEADWSAAVPFLCMGAFSPKGIRVTGLLENSLQPDRQILSLLEMAGASISFEGDGVTVSRNVLRALDFDASGCPDLVPAVSVLLGACDGESCIRGVERLRQKESDRLQAVADLLTAMDIRTEAENDLLHIFGSLPFSGGTAVACGDHRIAMAASVAACASRSHVDVSGSEYVSKSFPDYWSVFDSLEVSKP